MGRSLATVAFPQCREETDCSEEGDKAMAPNDPKPVLPKVPNGVGAFTVTSRGGTVGHAGARGGSQGLISSDLEVRRGPIGPPALPLKRM